MCVYVWVKEGGGVYLELQFLQGLHLGLLLGLRLERVYAQV